MKTSTITFLSFCVLALASCRKSPLLPVKGRGDSAVRTYELSGFNGIALSVDASVIYVQDDAYYVEIDAQPNIQEALDITVEQGILKIGSKKTLRRHHPIVITLHSPSLNSLELSGCGRFTANSTIRTDKLSVDVSGHADVSINSLDAQSLDAELSGSAKLDIYGGKLATQTLTGSGSCNVNTLGMRSETTTLRLSGSGNIKLWAVQQLDVRISGSGNVTYKGTPAIRSEISGSGSLQNI